MHPQLRFTLFGSPCTVVSYELFAVLGAVAAILTALPGLKKAGLSPPRRLILLAGMAVCFLLGARALNVLINPSAYPSILQPWSLRLAGLSLYGGMGGALAMLLVWAWRMGLDPWPLLDAMVLPMGTAFLLARIGCFLNGCCGGKATDSFLGVVFPANKAAGSVLASFLPILGDTTFAVYPTQLFEAAAALVGLLPALWLPARKNMPPGSAFLIYCSWFSAMRLAILPLRRLPYPAAVVQIIYPVMYGLLIAAGCGLLFLRLRQVRRVSGHDGLS